MLVRAKLYSKDLLIDVNNGRNNYKNDSKQQNLFFQRRVYWRLSGRKTGLSFLVKLLTIMWTPLVGGPEWLDEQTENQKGGLIMFFHNDKEKGVALFFLGIRRSELCQGSAHFAGKDDWSPALRMNEQGLVMVLSWIYENHFCVFSLKQRHTIIHAQMDVDGWI